MVLLRQCTFSRAEKIHNDISASPWPLSCDSSGWTITFGYSFYVFHFGEVELENIGHCQGFTQLGPQAFQPIEVALICPCLISLALDSVTGHIFFCDPWNDFMKKHLSILLNWNVVKNTVIVSKLRLTLKCNYNIIIVSKLWLTYDTSAMFLGSTWYGPT